MYQNRLKNIRNEAKLSQVDLGILLSLYDTTISSYERENSQPDFETIVKIAKRDDYKIATLRHTNTLKIGEGVLTIGSPLGEKYSTTATSGIISNLNII